ncbi:MFS transporter [bacterium]|nr:MFS transporter [bacterium]
MKKAYLVFLLIYMIMYEFIDTYSTSYYTAVVSYIQAYFHIAHSQWYSVMAIASLGMFLAMFSQFFADVVGRKPMLILIFCGMGLASLVMCLAQSVIQFSAGFFLLWTCVSSDIWVIVVSEEAPEAKRGRYASLVILFGAIGAIAIPVMRNVFIHVPPSVDPALWRTMTWVAIPAIPLSLLGLFLKETRAFRMRTSPLANRDVTIPLAKIRQPFFAATRSIMVVFLVMGTIGGMLLSALSTLEAYVTTQIQDTDIVNTTVYAASLGTLIFFGITGLLADTLGRRPVFCIYSGLSFISFAGFLYLMRTISGAENYLLMYLLTFTANGSFWGSLFLAKIHCLECFPTEIRGTASGWRTLSFAFGITGGSLMCSALSSAVPLDVLYIIFSGISVLVLPFLVIRYLPETKGIAITGE